MDASNLIIDNGNSTDHTNGIPEKLTLPAMEDQSLDGVNGTLRSMQLDSMSEAISELEKNEAVQSSMGKVEDESTIYEQNKSSNVSQKDREESKNSGNEQPSSPKHAVATFGKKNKDGNQVDATNTISNGSFSSTSHSKEPFAQTNRRSFNGRQTVKGNTSVDSGRPARSTSTPSSNLDSKKLGKSEFASSVTNLSQPEGVKKQTKDLKSLKQTHNNVEEDSISASLSPTAAGLKPQRMGTKPSYGFSFKCDERAEKRKEFFSKLEEKIHAKEMERTNMQAKSKETQEAEIKLLRKSLTFKATPMPSFYQEPPPPKVELKKIPVTRPKSPKFGRNKSMPPTSTKGNGIGSSQAGRLSLDSKVSQNSLEPTKHTTKPLRKSLPRLPSEKSTPANPADDALEAPSEPQNSDNTAKTLAAEQSPTDAKPDGPATTEEQPEPVEQESANGAALDLPSEGLQ
ncbi:hypothetical protein AAC387_Pa05g1789 [Persea americana]